MKTQVVLHSFFTQSLLISLRNRALKSWDTSKEGDPYVKAGTPTSILAPELLPKPTGRFGWSQILSISTRIIPTNGRMRQWLITILTPSRLAWTHWKKLGFFQRRRSYRLKKLPNFNETWWNSRSSSLIRKPCNVLNTSITLGYPKSQRLFF